MSFNPNIPNAGDLLSDSQGEMKLNFQTSNTSFGKDHYPFDDGTANNGYHKDVHVVKRVGDPAAVSGSLIVFSKDYTPDTAGATTDTQLYAMTSGGGISQLTGNNSQSDGWAYLSGVLIQWGVIVSIASSGSVVFKNRVAGAIPFPNNLFNVQMTVGVSGSTSHTGSIYVSDSGFSKTGFSWFNADRSTSQTRFYWFAVGN